MILVLINSYNGSADNHEIEIYMGGRRLMLMEDNQGWTRGPFHDHNSEVVCMREFFNCTAV